MDIDIDIDEFSSRRAAPVASARVALRPWKRSGRRWPATAAEGAQPPRQSETVGKL